ncbi:putative prenylated rab acceptor P [Helianthus annuus]|uniref:PRA1 family protein n=1 Tax=Helianthus annuus TaxID=4232 RepID=A0A251TUD0_HELAN|nr:PRA1 family protein B3 [Helianthus annuus]KAF5790406.1 putative prenylated rab acceptor PRA1 [Helianthus annuus]KAJ0525630.1 putative prenylated rab acceptor P [Helianthus annuus]KAJ0533822.1 putative prenylated rab acceptor P [Helianthus annuus]KAJ0542012.1 putative prenylated rab acceptor P [Helianthus annuus]KAJ0707077.1 putative prenylated rab acceptor P [Helianthus annuus]
MAQPTTTMKIKTTPSPRLPQSTTPTPTSLYHPIPPPSPSPDLRPFFSRLTTSLRNSFAQRRPWFEIIDRSTFRRPDTFSEATTRVRKNLSYFRVNYTAIIIILTILSLLSHPFPLIFFVSLSAAWLYLYLFRPPDQPALLFDHTFSDREILGILIILTILTVFLTGLGALLVSSIVFGLGITCVHGAFRVPQEVFVDNQDQMDAGILSFLIGTATSAAVATAPTIPRV